MTTPKHPTRVIYHHDPASLPAELHEQYEVRQAPRVDAVPPFKQAPVYQGDLPVYTNHTPPRVDTVRGPTIVIDDSVSITGGPNQPESVLLTDTVFGDVGPGVIPLPLPEYLNRPGRLVRDDAACGWRFEPA